MTKPISAAAASSIEAAISRLMGSGDVQATFTIARLASEAELSRATLYRAPELLERFRAAMASHEREMKSPPSSTDRVHQLEAEVATLRGRETEELRALRSFHPEHGAAYPGSQPSRAPATAPDCPASSRTVGTGTRCNARRACRCAATLTSFSSLGLRAPAPVAAVRPDEGFEHMWNLCRGIDGLIKPAVLSGITVELFLQRLRNADRHADETDFRQAAKFQIRHVSPPSVNATETC